MKLRTIAIGVVLAAALEGCLYLSWVHIDDNDAFPSLEIQLNFIAGIAIFFMPHTLAALARRGRPSLYLAAGLIGVILTVASVLSPVLLILTLPLVLIPSCVYLLRTKLSTKPRAPELITNLLMLLLAIASVWALLFMSTNDTRCYYRARFKDGHEIYREFHGSSAEGSVAIRYRPRAIEEESGCSSDVTTVAESTISLMLHGTMLLLGSVMKSRLSPTDPARGLQASAT
jgi:hypothetical protein